jgi:ParB/RepB/Spo0J family partition protein
MFDPNDCVTPPGNREVTLESVADLLPSIERIGQQVPGIVCPHPDLPGKYLNLDGNRRAFCKRILAQPFQAICLNYVPTKAELRRIRITTNSIRKVLTPDEIVADIEEHMADTGDIQEAAAEFFGLSAGYVSKLLAPTKRLCAELAFLRNRPDISRDVVRIIATMGPPEMQKQLADRVLAIIDVGGRAKRDAVERLARELKAAKRPKKARQVSASCDGARLALPGDWDWDRIKELGQRIVRAGQRGEKGQLPTSVLESLLTAP